MTDPNQVQRQAFLDWIEATIPGIESYFGLDKLQQWVKDGLSREYNLYFTMWQTNPHACQSSFVARLTGLNPDYATFMNKALNSGNTLRAQIAAIQTEDTQVNNQITQWTAIVNAPTTPTMLAFAQSLLQSYVPQKKLLDTTLAQYQADLAAGLKSGIYE